MATAVEIVSKDLELSPRVQRGLKLAQEGRFQKKQLWEGGLFSTVLDEETARLPLVKRKALAIKKVLSEMPVMRSALPLSGHDSFETSCGWYS